jgi:hypothetical protein
MKHGDWHPNRHDRLCVRGGTRSWHQFWCAVFARGRKRPCDCREPGSGQLRRHPPSGGAPAESTSTPKPVRAVARQRTRNRVLENA